MNSTAIELLGLVPGQSLLIAISDLHCSYCCW
jgi:hypothetical protein